MEEKIVDKILKDCQEEFYNGNYQQCLEKSKESYRLLERLENKNTKEKFFIGMILLLIIRCKILLKKNKTKKTLKYILLSIRYAQTENVKIFGYYLLSKYYQWINNIRRSYYFIDIVDSHEIDNNNIGCFSKMYCSFIRLE